MTVQNTTASPIADSREGGAGQIHLVNAGLVLLNPFLPQFFDRLGVLSTEGAMLGDAASKAVHLLQWVVDGRLDRPESDLVLNKRLCGLDPATPVESQIEASTHDIALCEQLLAAVIAAWKSLGQTSAAGLQGNFLQREGLLRHEARGWTLTVQRRTYDVLVDQIPWTFAIVHPRWMREPLHVRW
jgi:hypothetical protein